MTVITTVQDFKGICVEASEAPTAKQDVDRDTYDREWPERVAKSMW